MRRLLAIGAVLAVAASIPSRSAGARAYTLDQLLELARKGNPGLLAGAQATAAVEAQLSEARRSWLPSGDLSSLLAPAPELRCELDELDLQVFPRPPGVDAKTWREQHCYRTNLSDAQVRFGGIFTRTDVTLVQPVYTFGKISAAITAARSGVQASRNREAGLMADLDLNVKRAYFGAKLAREILRTIDEGVERLDEAEKTIEDGLKSGEGNFTVIDRHRLRTRRAEVDAQRLAAQRGAQIAVRGLRALIGAEAPADLEVDEEPLEMPNVPLRPVEHYEEQARLSRPEVRALDHLVAARRAQADLEWRRQLPDLVIVGTARLAYASSIDNPENAFANDPFNSTVAGVAAALRMPLDIGVRNARAARVAAEAEEAALRRREALGGIAFEVQRAHAELTEAQARAQALERGERAGKAWVSTVAQNFTVGLAEARDFIDALVAYFTARIGALQAAHDANLAAAALTRATGGDVAAR